MTTSKAAAYLKLDPFTGRAICCDCWDRRHGTRKSPVCQDPACCCACKDAPALRRKEWAARAAARQQSRELQQQMLESETNPLRASNPGQQEPWLKLPPNC